MLSVVGQVPFDFTGILRINLNTGEVILEPRDRSAELLQRACSALTGG
ncbi:MAG TPA: hypothetical protein VK875_01010 [Euzebyales bacterium]|nr:hypothetical protein [Euzebyales bacterium]